MKKHFLVEIDLAEGSELTAEEVEQQLGTPDNPEFGILQVRVEEIFDVVDLNRQ